MLSDLHGEIIKFIIEKKRGKDIQEKNKVWTVVLPTTKTYYKVIITKKVWNRTESRKIHYMGS